MSVSLPENPSVSSASVGKDYLLYVNTGTSGSPVWTLIGGQRSADLSRSADEIDVSHKTSGGWKGSKAGLRGWSIDLSGLILLSDSGLVALETAFDGGREINVKIKYPDGSVQTGWGSLTDFSFSTPHDGAAELSGTISGNGALSARAPSIAPLEESVSKSSATAKTFTITPSATTVSEVKDDGASMTVTTNYTYSSGTLTILSSYLSSSAVGVHTIEVTTGDGAKLTFRLTVTS